MSMDLHDLREGAWSLDDFVEQVNRLLPDLLPKDAGKRAAEPVNQRLVRHYATQGLLDEPLKEGREARYLYRHLLQLLVVRRLLAEGFTAAVVGQVLANRGDDELEGLLSGQLRIDLVPRQAPGDGRGSDRAEFLRQVRERAGLAVPHGERAGPAVPPSDRASLAFQLPGRTGSASATAESSPQPTEAASAPPPAASYLPANPFHD